MSENIENKVTESEEIRKEYTDVFIPRVHRIGRLTMAPAFVCAFLPVIYFVLIKGYTAPVSSYISVVVSIGSIAIGMWITEPFTYWPVLGSAGVYMSFLAGNTGSMRFPVALNLQSVMNADANTLRGQLVTIVGIASSVVANLILLLIFVLGGEWLLAVLPEVVLASFSFVMVGLFGSMIAMKLNGKEGLAKGFLDALPYLAFAIILKLVIDKIPALATIGSAVTVGLCVVLAYVLYKRDCKKDTQKTN